ncbi:formylglycine-generating enzyme family protein [Brucepastera parasyntrophica]|uniref:formylglycine-generating enzyme family protein n=1 Tax=Brucepastera parasyntrophica TaxID=2880008 RepID=UPI00210E2C77|nr:SUMF1/EgtB/PvdO family nonheme iron enzyme [Brucepastera parasyntrophica]ULQ60844.1 formylglycine-generating enzyme family protein [Brucepastera parasyntrophica]
MKRKNNGLIYTLLAAVTLTALVSLGCSNSFTERQSAANPAAGNGRVTVLINGGDAEARTLLPHGNSFTRYGLVFTAEGKTPVETGSTGASKTVDLEVGEWTLTVTGYVEIAGTEYEAATGSAGFEVTAESRTAVNVSISSRISDAAPGYFTYEVAIPTGQNFSAAALSLISLADGSVLYDIDLLDGDTENPGTVELDAGYYLMKLSLTNEYESAVTMEAVHIHSYMETKAVYGETYDWQFESFVPVGGTLTVNTIAGHSITGADIKLYSDSNRLDLIKTMPADLTETGNPWITYISARYTEVYIGIEMEDGGSRTFTRMVGPFDVTDGGDEAVALAVTLGGSITVSLDSPANGSMSVTVNGEAAAAAVEGDTVVLTGTLDTGYVLKTGSPKVTYAGGTDIYPDWNDGFYTFIMAGADVTVHAVFEAFPFDASRDMKTAGNVYWIADSEVTWELWNTVHTWATDEARGEKRYTLSAGQAGSNSSGGNIHEPVTMVNWYDCVAWCNALTEWYNVHKISNLAMVYTYGGEPVRDSVGAAVLGPWSIGQNGNAKGFRLPSDTEWLSAALWQGGGYTYASGATAPYTDAAATDAVAWYYDSDYNAYNGDGTRKTQIVKKKNPNVLGLYDMSGNVWEWSFHLFHSYGGRVHGGSYLHAAFYLANEGVMTEGPSETEIWTSIDGYSYTAQSSAMNYIGFRLARSD